MNSVETADTASVNEPRYASASDYVQLMKPRIMMLVVFTAAAGLVVAPGNIHPVMAAIVLLAVALGSGAAGVINMWYDADIDAIMKRTSTRPIPAGLIPAEEALAFGLIMSGISVIIMGLATNWFAAGLLAVSIVYYAVVYTMWLKRRTPHNIVIGGGAGAFPPVIGWAAVTGDATLDAWVLFAIIFFWTPPHFWALSLLAHGEYEKAGVPMLPVTHGAKVTRRHILAYSILLAPLGLLPVLTGMGGWLYLIVAGGLGLAFLWLAIGVSRSKAGDADAPGADNKRAKGLFAFSILYLFLVFAALIAEHGFGLFFPVLGAV